MSEWISVEDRLPKHNLQANSAGVEVLIWPRGDTAIAYYGRRVTSSPNFYIYGGILQGITYWMPLPETPRLHQND